jgi:hypothetical protein
VLSQPGYDTDFYCLVSEPPLSHFVDDFSLVSAFFVFSIGCLNILIGLIWRQSAKSKRSISSWGEHKKGDFPRNMEYRPSLSSIFEKHDNGSSRSGYGSGRQGEKTTALKGSSSLL